MFYKTGVLPLCPPPPCVTSNIMKCWLVKIRWRKYVLFSCVCRLLVLITGLWCRCELLVQYCSFPSATISICTGLIRWKILLAFLLDDDSDRQRCLSKRSILLSHFSSFQEIMTHRPIERPTDQQTDRPGHRNVTSIWFNYTSSY